MANSYVRLNFSPRAASIKQPSVRQLRLIPILFIVALALFFTIALPMNPDAVEQGIRKAGWMAPVAFGALMIVGILFAPIPTSPLTLMSVKLFGLGGGLLLSLTCATLGAVAAFSIARRLGAKFLHQYPQFQKFQRVLPPETSAYAVFMLRLPPSPTFDAVSYLAGLTSMKLWQFSLATFLGMIPVTSALCIVGDVLPMTWIWPFLVALLVFSGWIFWRKHHSSPSSGDPV